MPFCIPVGYESGCHGLLLGATGAGKTVSESWIAGSLIEAGHGAVVIDPKGDPALRYLWHAVGVMHAARITGTRRQSARAHGPHEIEASARKLPEAQAAQVQAYLDWLSDRQLRELAGVRDRLAILAESEIHDQLEPTPDGETIDLYEAVIERRILYFRLDSDRRPLLSAMLANSIVIDLVALVGRLQRQPTPTVVAIDEFSALGALCLAMHRLPFYRNALHFYIQP